MATSALTSADLDEMSFQDLRQMMISQGQKPKKMKRERMIHWLKDNLSLPKITAAEKRKQIAATEREKENQRAHELALCQLDRRATADFSNSSRTGQGPVPFKVELTVKLLPKFTEQNVEEYLITFEKMAEIHGWPCDKYTSILHAVLKWLKVFAELDIEDCKDFSKLKEALLNAYSVVSEVHRSRFRNRTQETHQEMR